MKEQVYLLCVAGVTTVVEATYDLPKSQDPQGYLDELERSYAAQNNHLQTSIYQRSQEFVENPREVPDHLALDKPVDIHSGQGFT